MARISIISHSAAYGNAGVLAEGMKHFADVTTSFFFPDHKHLSGAVVNRNIPDADHYIVVGAISLGHLPRKYFDKGVTVILTDSKYMMNHEQYNKLFKAYSFNVWAMPDLAPLANTDQIYYQPFAMPKLDLRKIDYIAHSPYSKLKMGQKGTDIIKSVCQKNNIPLTIITDRTWRETIEIKASHLYFVDQLHRGIGKSGLEAMLLKCCVLSGQKPEGDYLPPAVWTSAKAFEVDLLTLIFDRKETNKIIRKQYSWAKSNLDPKFVAQRIFNTI